MTKKRVTAAFALLVAAALLVSLLPLLPFSMPQAVAEQWTGSYEGSYYDNLNENLDGLQFREQLAQLITDTHSHQTSYNELSSVYAQSDADPYNNGNVIWFYTGTSVPYDGLGGSVGDTNREHVWPKDGGSAFPEKSGPGSDAHHLRPTETQLNSTRGSLNFDEVAQTSSNIVKENGSSSYGNAENGVDALCYKSGSFFYPAKGYRGATARILFYVQTRWGDQYNLEFVDSAGSCKTIGKISTLLKWHLEEPPTEEEIRRNEVVFGIQGNRNPFIDHPEYAAQIYCYDGESYNNALMDVLEASDDPYGNLNKAEIEGLSISPSTLTLTAGQTATLTAVPNPSNASAKVTWSSSDSAVASVSANGVVTAHKSGEVTVTAISAENSSVSATAKITVKDISGIDVTGTPQKTAYAAGETFDPAGLTVTAHYTDGTSATLNNADCKWLDGVTGSPTLSVGTTFVLCVVGSVQKAVQGITVVDDRDVIPADMDNLSESVPYKLVIEQQNKGQTLYIVNAVASTYYVASTTELADSDDVYVTLSGNGFYLYFDDNGQKLYLTAQVSGTHINLVRSSSPMVWQYDEQNDCIKTQVTVSGSSTWAYIGTYDNHTTFSTSDIKHVSTAFTAYLATVNNGETPPPTPTVTLDKASLSLEVGESATLVATASGTVEWSSSDTQVATVVNGKVTAVGAGRAVITATCGSAKATCTVTVTEEAPPTPTVTLDKTSLSLEVGESATLVATASGAVSWSSSDTQVVTVVNGKVTAVGAGRAVITATCGSAKATCTVTVTEKTSDKVAQFVAAVQNIPSEGSMSRKFESIKSALTLYDSLTAQEKAQVADSYAALQSAAAQYDEAAAAQNGHMKEALQGALLSAATISAAFLAIAALIKQQLL